MNSQLEHRRYAGLVKAITIALKYEQNRPDWPQVPFHLWKQEDRTEIMRVAQERWRYLPPAAISEPAFLNDLRAGNLNHLGNTPPQGASP